MIKKQKRYIRIFMFCVSLSIIIAIGLFDSEKSKCQSITYGYENDAQKQYIEENINTTNGVKKETVKIKQILNKEKTNVLNKWRIKIPKLNLDAPIAEGTTPDILLKTVGHFEETDKWKRKYSLSCT